MLRKEDIINTLNDLALNKTDYWILAGTGLVMHGVKEETKDIDLGCTTKLFEQLISKGCEARFTNDNMRYLCINEEVELYENWNVDEIEMIDSLPVGSLESIRKLKLKLGREKDLRDIEMIDEFRRGRKIKRG